MARTAAGPLTCGTCAMTAASASPRPATVRTWPPPNDVPHATILVGVDAGKRPGEGRAPPSSRRAAWRCPGAGEVRLRCRRTLGSRTRPLRSQPGSCRGSRSMSRRPLTRADLARHRRPGATSMISRRAWPGHVDGARRGPTGTDAGGPSCAQVRRGPRGNGRADPAGSRAAPAGPRPGCSSRTGRSGRPVRGWAGRRGSVRRASELATPGMGRPRSR